MHPEVLVVGVNHRSAPVEVRELVGVPAEALPRVLESITALPAVEEVLVLSTCNRVEAISVTRQPDTAMEQLLSYFERNWPPEAGRASDQLVVFRGREGVRHVFRVAAALDSMVVGEPQILGQLKQAYRVATQAGTIGVVLHRCLHKAFSVAKRVRTETGVGAKAVSVSSAAVELASKVFERLEDKAALLIGAGAMGQLTARHLISHGIQSLMVSNRSFDRAIELAREFHGTAVPFEELPRALQWADVVIGCATATQPVITADRVRAILRQRRYCPLVLIDLGVPRNFDPGLRQVDNVYLFDIDDLTTVAAENRESRAQEADKAEVVVDAEVASFVRWLHSLESVPTIVALRERVEAIRRAEVEKAILSLPAADPQTQRALDSVTRALVNKILHLPVTHLKREAAKRHLLYVVATRKLFGIDEDFEENG